MARILCAWELGGGYGHLAGLLPLALKLRECGHTVVLAVRDLARAETFFHERGFPILQAPIWFPDTPGLPPAVNYAEILFRVGYLEPTALAAVVRAWRSLFDLVRPDLLIADHAPTALVAARSANIARAVFGSGFLSPPRVHPMPCIQPWVVVPQKRLVASEQRAVEVINRVLESLGAPPLGILSDIFDVEENFLCTFPELDHYPGRTGARYWGPSFVDDEGVVPEWPVGAGEKVLLYFSPTYPHFETALQQFRDMAVRILVHAPGVAASLVRRYTSPQLRFSLEPIHMARATKECDVVVCHGGHGTVAVALLSGRPLVLLPSHGEQWLTANNIRRYGAGAAPNPDGGNPSVKPLVQEVLAHGVYAQRARAFAEKYADFSQELQLAEIVNRCEELLR